MTLRNRIVSAGFMTQKDYDRYVKDIMAIAHAIERNVDTEKTFFR